MPSTLEAEFDSYAEQYEEALGQGLQATGENSEYFARKRIAWTSTILNREIESVFDYGCGVGIAAPLLKEQFSPVTLMGYDPSTAAIARANANHSSPEMKFTANEDDVPENTFDLAYCNGVFHHIPVEHRSHAFSIVLKSLKPGGAFAFWENNPWNPGTRYVMSKVPFDRDAITISPPEAKSLLLNAGFEVQFCHAWFLFPRMLKWLRPLEYLLHTVPVGAQYIVLANKPG